jgi:Sec-independent protein translocase protein TatA
MFAHQKWLLIGWLIILTLGIIVVSVYTSKRLIVIEMKFKKRIQEVKEEMKELKQRVEQLQKEAFPEGEKMSEIDTSDWKTYRFAKSIYEVGYEIKYPPNWTIEELKDVWEVKWYSPKRIPEDVIIEVSVLPVQSEGNFDPINCVSLPSQYKTMYSVIGREKFGENEFCKVAYKGGEGRQIVQSIEYVIVKGKYQYNIALWIIGGRQTREHYLPENEFQQELKIFSQMLSTFKFIP